MTDSRVSNNKQIKKRILLVNGMILISMIIYGAFMVATILQQRKTASWVSHTHEVISHAQKLLGSMVDQETGQRGFLIVGVETYLQPFDEGRVDFLAEIKYLKKLVRDNPPQLNRLQEIVQLSDHWQQQSALPEIEARNRVNRGEADMAEIITMIQVGAGKGLMDRLRGKVDQFIIVEKRLIIERTIELQRSTDMAIKLSALGILLLFLLGAGLTILTVRKI